MVNTHGSLKGRDLLALYSLTKAEIMEILLKNQAKTGGCPLSLGG